MKKCYFFKVLTLVLSVSLCGSLFGMRSRTSDTRAAVIVWLEQLSGQHESVAKALNSNSSSLTFNQKEFVTQKLKYLQSDVPVYFLLSLLEEERRSSNSENYTGGSGRFGDEERIDPIVPKKSNKSGNSTGRGGWLRNGRVVHTDLNPIEVELLYSMLDNKMDTLGERSVFSCMTLGEFKKIIKDEEKLLGLLNRYWQYNVRGSNLFQSCNPSLIANVLCTEVRWYATKGLLPEDIAEGYEPYSSKAKKQLYFNNPFLP